MLQQIDHVVVLVRDLAQAAADFEHAGFTVTPGGEHTGGATRNALIPLADGAYFELIAFTEPERPREHRWWPRLAQGEGFIDYAVLSDNVTVEAQELVGRGLPLRRPEEGGRRRPDGEQLRWRSLLLGRGVGHPALPFVIEDVTPRALRVPGGDATRHRLPVARLAGLTIVVEHLTAARAAFTALVGAPEETLGQGSDGETVRFRLGAQWLDLLHPADSGPAAPVLTARGAGLYEVVLTGSAGAAPVAATLLPLEQTHGARIRVVR